MHAIRPVATPAPAIQPQSQNEQSVLITRVAFQALEYIKTLFSALIELALKPYHYFIHLTSLEQAQKSEKFPAQSTNSIRALQGASITAIAYICYHSISSISLSETIENASEALVETVTPELVQPGIEASVTPIADVPPAVASQVSPLSTLDLPTSCYIVTGVAVLIVASYYLHSRKATPQPQEEKRKSEEKLTDSSTSENKDAFFSPSKGGNPPTSEKTPELSLDDLREGAQEVDEQQRQERKAKPLPKPPLHKTTAPAKNIGTESIPQVNANTPQRKQIQKTIESLWGDLESFVSNSGKPEEASSRDSLDSDELVKVVGQKRGVDQNQLKQSQEEFKQITEKFEALESQCSKQNEKIFFSLADVLVFALSRKGSDQNISGIDLTNLKKYIEKTNQEKRAKLVEEDAGEIIMKDEEYKREYARLQEEFEEIELPYAIVLELFKDARAKNTPLSSITRPVVHRLLPEKLQLAIRQYATSEPTSKGRVDNSALRKGKKKQAIVSADAIFSNAGSPPNRENQESSPSSSANPPPPPAGAPSPPSAQAANSPNRANLLAQITKGHQLKSTTPPKKDSNKAPQTATPSSQQEKMLKAAQQISHTDSTGSTHSGWDTSTEER